MADVVGAVAQQELGSARKQLPGKAQHCLRVLHLSPPKERGSPKLALSPRSQTSMICVCYLNGYLNSGYLLNPCFSSEGQGQIFQSIVEPKAE